MDVRGLFGQYTKAATKEGAANPTSVYKNVGMSEAHLTMSGPIKYPMHIATFGALQEQVRVKEVKGG